MLLYIAIGFLICALMPRRKCARRGDRVHFITIALRERYNEELARKIAGQL